MFERVKEFLYENEFKLAIELDRWQHELSH